MLKWGWLCHLDGLSPSQSEGKLGLRARVSGVFLHSVKVMISSNGKVNGSDKWGWLCHLDGLSPSQSEGKLGLTISSNGEAGGSVEMGVALPLRWSFTLTE